MASTKPKEIKCPGCKKIRKAPIKAKTSKCGACKTVVELKAGKWIVMKTSKKAKSNEEMNEPTVDTRDIPGHIGFQACPVCEKGIQKPYTKKSRLCHNCVSPLIKVEKYWVEAKGKDRDPIDEKGRKQGIVFSCPGCNETLRRHKSDAAVDCTGCKDTLIRIDGSWHTSSAYCPNCDNKFTKRYHASYEENCPSCKSQLKKTNQTWRVVKPAKKQETEIAKTISKSSNHQKSQKINPNPVEELIVCPGCQDERQAPKTQNSSSCRKCGTVVYKHGQHWNEIPFTRAPEESTLTLKGLFLSVLIGYFFAKLIEPTELGKLFSFFGYGGLYIFFFVLFVILALYWESISASFAIFAITFAIAFTMQDIPKGWNPGKFDSDKFIAELKFPSMPSMPSIPGIGNLFGSSNENFKEDQIELAEIASKQGNHRKAAKAYGLAGAAAAAGGDLNALEALLNKQARERTTR